MNYTIHAGTVLHPLHACCSVFGLYGDLMNVGDYDTGSGQELEHGSSKEIHKSDPDLDTIPYRIGTLDRYLYIHVFISKHYYHLKSIYEI